MQNAQTLPIKTRAIAAQGEPVKPIIDSLILREEAASFASSSAILEAREPQTSWDYALFRRCRTFDEVKSLAQARGFKATNEMGYITLKRKGAFIAGFWLFD